MQNVNMTRNGDKLTIEIDLRAPTVPSKSGKTLVVATTRGNANVPGEGDYRIGLNLYTYPNK